MLNLEIGREEIEQDGGETWGVRCCIKGDCGFGNGSD